MFSLSAERFSWFLVLALFAAFFVGCGGDESTGDSDGAPEESGELADEPISDAALEKLTLLDAFDGATDKVVTECAGCAMSMAGKPEHALQAGDYTLHFCNPHCAADFAKAMNENILAAEIPGK